MEAYLFQHALREYFRPRRLWPWLVLAGFCFLMARLWGTYAANATPEETYLQVSGLVVFRILGLASAIFVTSIVSQEVEQKTITYLLTRPIARWKIIVARFAATVMVVFAIAAVCAVATSLGATGSLGNPKLVSDLLGLALGALAYCALFLLITLVINRPMTICLLFVFGWETVTSAMPGDLYRAAIISYLAAISGRSKSGPGLLPQTLDPHELTLVPSLLGLTVFALAILALSAAWFSYFEFVPREDAE